MMTVFYASLDQYRVPSLSKRGLPALKGTLAFAEQGRKGGICNHHPLMTRRRALFHLPREQQKLQDNF